MQSTVSLGELYASWREQAEVCWCQWGVKSAGRIDTWMMDTWEDIHAFEREGLFVWCYTKHSATLHGDSIFHPPWCRNRIPCLKLVWAKMKREASTAMFTSFWCLGNAHSIIKAALHVKVFVQFPEQQPSWELVMESRSFETVVAFIQARCLCSAFRGDWMEIYIISTLRDVVSDLVERNKERWRNL